MNYSQLKSSFSSPNHELEISIVKDDWLSDLMMNDCYIASADEEMVTVDDGSFGYSSDGVMNSHCHQTIDRTSALFMLDNIKEGELFRSMEEEEHRLTGVVVEKSEGIESGSDQQSSGGNTITCFDPVLVNSDCSFICEQNGYAFANSTTAIGQDGLIVPCASTYSRRNKKGACVPVGSDMLSQAEGCEATFKSNSTITIGQDGLVVPYPATYSRRKKEVCVPVDSDMLDSESPGGESMANVEGDQEYVIEPVDCPQAVVDYFCIKSCGDQSKLEELKRTGVTISSLAFKAKQHLASAGWKLSYRKKQESNQLCYTSPLPPRKCETTLIAACKRCMRDNHLIVTDDSIPGARKLKGAPNGSRNPFEKNDICKGVQGFSENTTEGFVFTAKNSGVGCREGFVSSGRREKRRENKSTHSYKTEAEGLHWGTRKVYSFVPTPLPANWQAIKGYYTEPHDTLDLEELDDEYDRELKQMVKDNHIEQEKRKQKLCIDRLVGCSFNFNGGL